MWDITVLAMKSGDVDGRWLLIEREVGDWRLEVGRRLPATDPALHYIRPAQSRLALAGPLLSSAKQQHVRVTRTTIIVAPGEQQREL